MIFHTTHYYNNYKYENNLHESSIHEDMPIVIATKIIIKLSRY